MDPVNPSSIQPPHPPAPSPWILRGGLALLVGAVILFWLAIRASQGAALPRDMLLIHWLVGGGAVLFLVAVGAIIGYWRRSEKVRTHRLETHILHANLDLAQSEVRYRTLVDHMREGVALIDLQTRQILLTNRALRMIFAVPDASTASGAFNLLACLPEDARARLTVELQSAAPLPRAFTCQATTLTGQPVWLDARFSPLDLDGKQVGMLMISDVSETRRVEDSLRESEQRFHDLYDSARRQAREMELMIQVRLALASEIDLPVVFRRVVEATAATYGYSLVSIYLIKDKDLLLEHQVGYAQAIERIPLRQGITGRVARSGLPMLVKDVTTEDSFLEGAPGVVSEVCVPLTDEGRVVGVFNAETSASQILDENDLRIMTELSQHLSLAIGRSRLYNQAREIAHDLGRQNEYLNALHETTLGLINRLDLNDLLSAILSRAGQLLDTENAYIYIYRPDPGVIEVTHGVGIYSRFIGYRMRPGEGLAGKVLITGKPIVVEDYDAWSERSPVFPAGLFHAALGAPLTTGDQVIGVLGVTYLDTGRKFAAAEVETASRFAQLVSLALENARLVSGMQSELGERSRVEKALRESEERYVLAVRGANDGIWDWDLRSDTLYTSPRWKSMLGLSDEPTASSPQEWLARVHPDDIAHLQADIEDHLAGHTQHLASEHRLRHADGAYRWVLARGLAVADPDQAPHRLAGSLTDITDRKIAEERLRHDAMHDPLTSLPNRLYFMDQLRRSLERVRRRNGYLAAVLFMDLDRFKIVNDSLGHSPGDQMLIDISTRLMRCLRAGDTIARFGGDEFAILLDDIVDVQDAVHIANRIQEELSLPFMLQGHEIFSSASIGIALTNPESNQPEELLRDADTAMYQAKAAGRARYQIFNSQMHSQSMAVLRLEGELRRGIERHEFVLHYQPIISLRTGRITTLEALARWNHPERGLIYPDEFIGLAEETGQIVPLGEWALLTACNQARIWRAEHSPDLRMAVNLSARQLQDPNLPALVNSVLEASGLPAEALQLEITESAAMHDIDLTIATLSELKRMGVNLSIDDFGTSYSSLDYLKRFPVTSIKIDRSFIRDITDDMDDAAITTAIIAMGHILNLGLIAEGVETPQQMAFLIAQRCDECQGFLIYRPAPAEETTPLLGRQIDLMHEYFPLYNTLPTQDQGTAPAS